MLGDFSNAAGGVFANELVAILELVEDLGEDVVVYDCLGQIEGVSSDIGQAGADLPLELGVLMVD